MGARGLPAEAMAATHDVVAENLYNCQGKSWVELAPPHLNHNKPRAPGVAHDAGNKRVAPEWAHEDHGWR
jgi:hypothetical protein